MTSATGIRNDPPKGAPATAIMTPIKNANMAMADARIEHYVVSVKMQAVPSCWAGLGDVISHCRFGSSDQLCEWVAHMI